MENSNNSSNELNSSIDPEELLAQQKAELRRELKEAKSVQMMDLSRGNSFRQNAGCWSRAFFSWTYPIIRYARSN